MKIAPFGRVIDAAVGESTRFARPTRKGGLRLFNLFAAHPVEEIVGGVKLTDMIKA
jgi:hypothetical protein